MQATADFFAKKVFFTAVAPQGGHIPKLAVAPKKRRGGIAVGELLAIFAIIINQKEYG